MFSEKKEKAFFESHCPDKFSFPCDSELILFLLSNGHTSMNTNTDPAEGLSLLNYMDMVYSLHGWFTQCC